jgi:putative FmdB family regulatory protein
MPSYEYECANCKYYTEIMQKLSDAPLRKCPSCGKNTLKKLVSAPVFRLKGAGWYETDFKSDKEGKRNLAEKEKEPQAEKKEEAAKGTEAKAADTPADAKAPETKASETKASETKSTEKGSTDAKSSSASRRSVHSTRRVVKSPTAKSRPKSRSAPRKHR